MTKNSQNWPKNAQKAALAQRRLYKSFLPPNIFLKLGQICLNLPNN